jgi:nicotinamide mononucleotide transporter
MEILTYMFSLNETLFSIGTYAVSPLEAWATITGLASVILARKNLVSNFYIGLINCVGFGALFFQIQLYSDMLLQLFFIAMSVYGIWLWRQKIKTMSSQINRLRVRHLSSEEVIAVLLMIGGCTLVLGYGINDLFELIGSTTATLLGVEYTFIPAALPYRDAFTTVTSIVAFTLMVRRYVESWVLWIAVNVVCIANYYEQGVYVLTFEYLVFLCNAIMGYIAWRSIARVEHNMSGNAHAY